jgi:cell division protein FtsA
MAKDIFYTALDIGTSKICTIVARVGPEGELNIIGTGLAPSQGLAKGSIVNVSEAQEAIRASLAQGQRYLGRNIPWAYVSISGRQITCLNATGLTQSPAQEGPVSLEDVHHLIKASHPKVGAEKEVIHVIPVNYQIDGLRGVRNPVGLHADRLQVESHVVLGDRPLVQDTMRAVESSGISVRGLVLSVLASSEATLSEHEKEMGVVLIDLGDGASDIAIFKHGSLWYNASIPVGGRQLTKDLSVALGLPYYFAEELKVTWGHAAPEESEGEEEVLLPSFQGRPRRLIRRSTLCRPLVDRLQETLGLIMVKTQQAGLTRFPPGGVVITGGTAEIPGLQSLAEQVFGCPVRIASPVGIPGLPQEQSKPSYATAVGLLLWGIKHHGEKVSYGNGDRGLLDHKAIFHRLKRLIEVS